jgi:CheY-like chemotaxis protein
MLEFVLNERGYEVFTFSNPGLFQIDEPADHNCLTNHACADMIISDVNMPSKNGLELIRELQQKGCKVKCRALMSGDWTDSDLKHAQQLGCKIFHKPFDIRQLLEWLNDCVKKINSGRKLSDF